MGDRRLGEEEVTMAEPSRARRPGCSKGTRMSGLGLVCGTIKEVSKTRPSFIQTMTPMLSKVPTAEAGSRSNFGRRSVASSSFTRFDLWWTECSVSRESHSWSPDPCSSNCKYTGFYWKPCWTLSTTRNTPFPDVSLSRFDTEQPGSSQCKSRCTSPEAARNASQSLNTTSSLMGPPLNGRPRRTRREDSRPQPIRLCGV